MGGAVAAASYLGEEEKDCVAVIKRSSAAMAQKVYCHTSASAGHVKKSLGNTGSGNQEQQMHLAGKWAGWGLNAVTINRWTFSSAGS
jgi:hypothetical protein